MGGSFRGGQFSVRASEYRERGWFGCGIDVFGQFFGIDWTSPFQVFEDPHIKEVGIVQTVVHPVAGEIKMVGPPVSYDCAENRVRSPPPLLGEHTKDVLKELLDYSDDEIEKLIQEKIIQ